MKFEGLQAILKYRFEIHLPTVGIIFFIGIIHIRKIELDSECLYLRFKGHRGRGGIIYTPSHFACVYGLLRASESILKTMFQTTPEKSFETAVIIL